MLWIHRHHQVLTCLTRDLRVSCQWNFGSWCCGSTKPPRPEFNVSVVTNSRITYSSCACEALYIREPYVRVSIWILKSRYKSLCNWWSVCQSDSPSVSQCVLHSPVRQSVRPSVNPSVSQTVRQTVSQSVSQSVSGTHDHVVLYLPEHGPHLRYEDQPVNVWRNRKTESYRSLEISRLGALPPVPLG
jgi:hypothetical protein